MTTQRWRRNTLQKVVKYNKNIGQCELGGRSSNFDTSIMQFDTLQDGLHQHVIDMLQDGLRLHVIRLGMYDSTRHVRLGMFY